MDRAQAAQANLSFSIPGGILVRSVQPDARLPLRQGVPCDGIVSHSNLYPL